VCRCGTCPFPSLFGRHAVGRVCSICVFVVSFVTRDDALKEASADTDRLFWPNAALLRAAGAPARVRTAACALRRPPGLVAALGKHAYCGGAEHRAAAGANGMGRAPHAGLPVRGGASQPSDAPRCDALEHASAHSRLAHGARSLRAAVHADLALELELPGTHASDEGVEAPAASSSPELVRMMPKRTWQPNRMRRKRKHGFLKCVARIMCHPSPFCLRPASTVCRAERRPCAPCRGGAGG
jgi:hypothetical protein